MGNLKFGDKSTKDLGLVIQFKPNYSFPERDITVEHIPGRDGDIVIDNGCYQNVTRTYSVAAIFNPAEGFVQSATKIVEWLTKTKGYQRLEDTYEPEVFRLAMFNDRGSLPNYYDRATVFEINFNCKPQRFLKEGEVPIEFVGSEALLENPTEETANPLITIRGLEQQADNSVLLASVLDNDGKATSLMTLSAIPSNNIHIDSEAQDVYSDDKDLKQYISLNGYSFPKLGKKNTTIKVASYKEAPSGVISAYNTLINNNKKVLYAKYLPYDKIVESKQKSYAILPFDLLKQKKQEVYEAKAYSTYCLEKAESYTVQSINDLLTQYGYSFSIVGSKDENLLPEWLSLEYVPDTEEKEMILRLVSTDRTYTNTNPFWDWVNRNFGQELSGYYDTEEPPELHTERSVSMNGVFIKNNITKDIKYYSFGDVIHSGLKVSSTSSFEIYFARDIGFQHPILYVDFDMNYVKVLINFPKWLGANFNYESVEKRYQVTKVLYQLVNIGEDYSNEKKYDVDDIIFHTEIQNEEEIKQRYMCIVPVEQPEEFDPEKWRKINNNAFIYEEKSGLFGKSKWNALGKSTIPYNLDSVTWASYKKAFISLSGLSVDVHKTFTYRYLSVIPQYEPVMGPKLDNDGKEVLDPMGNVVEEEKNKVHFTVSTADINSNVVYNAIEAGFYRVEISGQESSQQNWKHIEVGGIITDASKDSTKSQIIYYLESIPTYYGEENFPDWLDSKQIPSEAYTDINADIIRFTVLKNGFYTVQKFNDDGTPKDKPVWTWYEVGTTLPVDPFALDHDKNSTMYFIEAETNVFPVKTYHYEDDHGHTINNIGFFIRKIIDDPENPGKTKEIEEECPNNVPPDYVKVTITQPEGEDIKDSDKILHFITNYENFKGEYSSESTYSKYDIVQHNDIYYRCKKDVEEPEEFDPEKWDKADCLYKWDSGLEWTLHTSGYEMTESTYDQDTTIEYLAGYPEYTGESWQSLYNYEIIKAANGNPTNIKFKVASENGGYFRPEGISSWKFMQKDDEIITSKLSEMTNIYNLALDQEADLNNVEITVIPRWWKL